MVTHRLIHRPTLGQRIVSKLASRPATPMHYKDVAAVLHTSPQKVVNTCIRLAHQGRLVRVGEGTYALPKEDRA